MDYPFEYDNLFIYAPSFLSSGVDEGKSIGTAKSQDLGLISDLHKITATMLTTPQKLTRERKIGATVGKRKLKSVQGNTEKELNSLIVLYEGGIIDEDEFKKKMVRTMKLAWRDSFAAGLRAGGVPGAGRGSKQTVNMSLYSDKWLMGAMKQEMQFLNKFMRAVIDDDYTMSLEIRARMYVRTLESFYDTGRVLALPDNTVIHWLGPNDKVTCAGCEFMFNNNPYTKHTLPTVPRAGLTPCLSNCRDRLLLRRVSDMELKTKLQDTKYTKGTMIKKLRKIKSTGKL